MTMSAQSGNMEMCISMALPERRECVPTYSRANPSMSTPTRQVSDRRTVMMYKALMEQSPWMISRIVSDRGGGRAPMLLHVEEDVEARLDQAGS